MHQIILHDFTSGRRKVVPYNRVPKGTTVHWGTAWCIINCMQCLNIHEGVGVKLTLYYFLLLCVSPFLQGYLPTIFYPKRPDKTLFNNLMTQCASLDIPFLSYLPSASLINNSYNFVVDALFGFSFKGEVRAPFGEVLDTLKNISIPLCSIDVPSGKISRLVHGHSLTLYYPEFISCTSLTLVHATCLRKNFTIHLTQSTFICRGFVKKIKQFAKILVHDAYIFTCLMKIRTWFEIPGVWYGSICMWLTSVIENMKSKLFR